MPGTPLAFQGDPGHGLHEPQGSGKWKWGICVVLEEEAAELNVSFVPACPRRWREVGRALGADTACCAYASLTAPGLGAESCRLTNP